MAGLNDRKTALMWAAGWWFTRRYIRRRAARAISGVGARASAPGRFRIVVAALALVGAVAGAFIVWRRFGGASRPDDRGFDAPPPDEPVPPSPAPTEAVAA
jgi:hypothetical protein